jgi:hypothetical protein
MQIAGLWAYFLAMARTDAQKELERIEEELNTKAAPPAEESRIARVNRKQPHLDAVLIGVIACKLFQPVGHVFLLELLVSRIWSLGRSSSNQYNLWS